MGRRSINTTKSGKYMNPTDQARKEARKKELKKNKRQRQIVRTAVLRGKDPMQLLGEMEKIDQMEYNVLQPSPLNEKVLKDKRKKLRDTFDRVMKMYHKDDPEKWDEIRRAEGDYEKRRNTLLSFYEAVRHTQQVTVDEIPLPLSQITPDGLPNISIPLPPMPNEYGMLPLSSFNATLPPPPGILRKKSAYSPPPSPSKVSKRNKIPPGVPPGPPPELSGEEDATFEDSDSDREYEMEREKRLKAKKKGFEKKGIRFADNESSDSDNGEAKKKKGRVQSSGHEIDQFMKEMEEVHKKREAERGKGEDIEKLPESMLVMPPTGQMPPGLPPAPPLGVPPPLMFRPPSVMMGPGSIRLPPGPPPGRPPTLPPGPPPGLPPRLGNPGMRLPPGPPPGMPPNMMRYPPGMMMGAAAQNTPNVLSAAPQLISRDDGYGMEEPTQKSSATIEAKAKIRHLNADVTRFLPTSVRIKRDDGKSKPKFSGKISAAAEVPKLVSHKSAIHPAPAAAQPSKDDAYMQFMKEMQGLL